MKATKTLLGLAVLLTPAIAAAQPGYYGNGGGGGRGGYYNNPAPRAPGGFHERGGRLTWGASLGLGGMSDSGGDITCANCNYSPLSGEGDVHIGGMLNERFALLFEAQVNVQTLSLGADSSQDVILTQGAAMVAGQYWLTPQLWLKAGIGVANLQVSDSYDAASVDNGTALLGAVGYEILSARNFSVDLQGRLINGAYKGIDDNITAGSIGVGINWY